MAKLSKIIKVTQEQHDTLIQGGSVDGHVFDPEAIYLVSGDTESSAILSLLAPGFSTDSSKTYAVGDLCTRIEDSVPKLYRCIAATTGGTFVSNKWETTTLFEAILGALGGSY